MYKYCRYILVILFLNPAFAAIEGKNSSDAIDTVSGQGLVEQAKLAFDANSQKTEEYALRALEIGIKQGDQLLINKARYQLVRANFRFSRTEKALEYAQLAEEGFTKLNSLYDLADLYSTWANGLFDMGNNALSDSYSSKSIALARQTGNYNALVTQLYTCGMKSYRNYDYYLAIDYVNEALPIAEKYTELDRIRAYCYNLLGSIYETLLDLKLSREFRFRAIHIFEKLNMTELLVTNYSNLSVIYSEDNMPDSAYYFAQKAYKTQQSIKTEHSIASVYRAFFRYHLEAENLDSAAYYINRSIEIGEQYNRQSSLVIYYERAGLVYRRMGDFNKSLFYYKKARQLSQELNIPEIQLATLNGIACVFYQQNQLDSAAYYFYKHQEADTLKTIEKIQQNVLKLSELRIREQTEFHLREAKSKRLVLICFLIGSLIVVALLTVLLRKISKQHNKINQINDDLREHQDELKLLVEYKSRQLDDKEKQYANLCDNMFNGAVFRLEADSIEPLDLRFSFVSSGWQTITGLPIDNLNEMMFGFKQNIPAGEKEQLFGAIANAFKTGTVVDEAFSFNKGEQKAWFHIRAASTSIQEQTVSLDGYMVDETEEKIFEDKLVAAKERAEESDRLKTAFLNNVSHEIRTPMNAIIGFSTLIVSDEILAEEKDIFLKTINDNCFQLLQIINNIVEISRIDTEHAVVCFSSVTMGEIISDISKSIITPYRERYPNIEIRVDENIEKIASAVVNTDKTRLIHVIENLIDNATKFTTKGYVEFGIIPETGKIHFYIKDSGIGIAPEDTGRIFDSFVKINPTANSGTGLGLSIIKKILAKLGGKVWVESELNIGSVFHITIPEE